MEKIKVAYIGDSPFIYSGFGVVAKSILSRLDPGVFDISVLGTMFQHYPSRKDMEQIPGLTYYTPSCIHDSMGFKSAIDYIQYVNPDVLFLLGDPGTLRSRFSVMMLTGATSAIPAVTYFPLEGAPFNPHIVEQAKMVHGPVTYTKWGADLLKEYGVEVNYIWHGVDHANFIQYDSDVKKRLRKLVGWDDRFVVGMVGVNKRVNRQPVMIEAARILKDRGLDDVQIYLHCQISGDAMMGGWDLGWMLEAFDVVDMVQTKPNQVEHMYIGRPRTGTLEQMLDLSLPKDKDEELENLASLDFISLLNIFDLYVDPASSHGFNLPAAEASRCGVPIAMANDKFARTEIFGDVAHMIEPSASDYWHTGAALPLISPSKIADAIADFRIDGEMRNIVGGRCKEKFDSIKWEPVADLFSQKIIDAYEWGIREIRR